MNSSIIHLISQFYVPEEKNFTDHISITQKIRPWKDNSKVTRLQSKEIGFETLFGVPLHQKFLLKQINIKKKFGFVEILNGS